ncbi:DUF4244 domain-containing protein [Lentzea tibetensis]|uniref:DUF4244 domain-containing protein n=1 Tax=Lentzea tibetensis TaxID=2591470 RepID=A0A563EUM0_9PSEU|nr:DUF4244 domain-containing protein [Lentzea tibetensis]TWP51417.1 DUF4244 domain-containing protein [Lentzea tibetensis]
MLKDDSGMSTIEYALGTVAAAALAATLYVVLSSDAVQAKIAQLVQGALSIG